MFPAKLSARKKLFCRPALLCSHKWDCKMKHIVVTFLIICFLAITPNNAFASLLNLGPEEIVEANGVDIEVPGYSVPSFVDWNNDSLKDLIIGQGSGTYPPGKVRVYLNVGTESNPQFSDYFYVQSNDADLTVPAASCLGCFPRVVYWDADDRKDLLVGLADGIVKIFLNIGTDSKPAFGGGHGILTWWDMYELDVGSRATPTLLDWDNDGRTDLIAGALDGKIHMFINCGCGGAVPPSFFTTWPSGDLLQQDGSDLVVPSERSSPVVLDLDGDGNKDLLTGNTDGQLLFYRNVGTDADPNFSGYSLVESDGVPIDLPGSARSRPFVCYWTGDGHFGPIDGYPDVLIGAADGKVHLYQGIPEIGDIDGDGDVDCIDFALFAAHWQHTPDSIGSCGRCSEADFTGDGKVDIDDLRQLAANWLVGAS